ncbi:MAG: Asp-tRNA(Asn)/Glu-tRNA(Gln) amidotransferase subunit GatA, partial [Hungatella sp.]|nr:Asp-tRNA(Asn)/Glu-tRNA(Gln) amidotransferase subunit GatA [Hungatella sp.]
GLPGLTVPCGRDSKGLPIGVQFIGDCFKEKNIIRAGFAFEQSRSYEMPPMAADAILRPAGREER